MAKIELDLNWVSQMREKAGNYRESDYDFVYLQGDVDMRFRVLPPSANNPGRLGLVEGSHWVKIGDKSKRITCVEESFPEKGVICPICEAVRKLKNSNSIDEDSLEDIEVDRQAYIKVVMISHSKRKYNGDKISILKCNDYNLMWLLEQHLSADTPNFLDPENGNVIHIYRNEGDTRYTREIESESCPINANKEVLESLLAKNEEIDLHDIVKFPDDEKMTEIAKLADDYLNSFNQINKLQEESLDKVMQSEMTASASNALNAVESAPSVEINGEPVNKSKTKKPNGAPDCFGDSNSYNSSDVKCIRCPFDYECNDCIKASIGL